MCDEFEAAFQQASKIIAAIPGYLSHELQKCIEVPNRYILQVLNWIVKWSNHPRNINLGQVMRFVYHKFTQWMYKQTYQ